MDPTQDIDNKQKELINYIGQKLLIIENIQNHDDRITYIYELFNSILSQLDDIAQCPIKFKQSILFSSNKLSNILTIMFNERENKNDITEQEKELLELLNNPIFQQKLS